ncbi:MAG: DMT family transporter [Candidatus Aenigmarchaeota archaeon]|nr:DMT family transporter [Candidatus Aenigmarchaeota archaeon]
MNKETKGTLLALATALVSGIAIPVNKLFVVGIDPIVFTATRALMIGLIFLVIGLKRGEFTKNKLKFMNWKYLLAIGIIGGGLAFWLYFSGLRLTTSGRGAFLHKTLPLYTTILAFLFLKEKISKKQLLALGLMFFGIIMIYFDKIAPNLDFWPNPSFGDLLVIIATFLWAVENTIGKKLMRDDGESNILVSFARMFVGSLFLFGLILVLGKIDVLLSLSLIQIRNLIISTGILFCYVSFWYSAVKLINISKAATILLISPVISMILGILMFNEPTPGLQLLGSVLILAGGYLVSKVKSGFVEGV